MKPPPDHAGLLDGFYLEVPLPASWPDESRKRLKKYGRWYGALVEGSIQALSDQQREFAALFRGEVERDPQTVDEIVWDAYLRLIRHQHSPKVRASGMSLRTVKDPNAPHRLGNGDDDHVYFVRPRRR